MPNPSPMTQFTSRLEIRLKAASPFAVRMTWQASPATVRNIPTPISCNSGHTFNGWWPIVQTDTSNPAAKGVASRRAASSEARQRRKGFAAMLPTRYPITAPAAISVRKWDPRKVRLTAIVPAAAKIIQRALGNRIANTVATANDAAAWPEGNESQPLPLTGESSTVPACRNLGRGRPMRCFIKLLNNSARPWASRLCHPAAFQTACLSPNPTVIATRLKMMRESPFPSRSPTSLSWASQGLWRWSTWKSLSERTNRVSGTSHSNNPKNVSTSETQEKARGAKRENGDRSQITDDAGGETCEGLSEFMRASQASFVMF